jgi:hypothetical protein
MLEEFEVFSKTRAFSEILENIKELGNIDLILRNYLCIGQKDNVLTLNNKNSYDFNASGESEENDDAVEETLNILLQLAEKHRERVKVLKERRINKL